MKLNENTIEQYAIELLQQQGFQYLYGPHIAPDGENPERAAYEDVLLTNRLKNAIQKINPSVPAEVQEEALKEVRRVHSSELIAANETFHRMLTEGIKVTYQKDGQTRGDSVCLIDFQNPGNNEFVVVNQFTVIENGVNKRPDIVLFVNGIPLVVMELKNAANENATIQSAFRQIQTYKQSIPSLFTYNAFSVISDGFEARAGTLSADMSRFMAWKSADGKREASQLVSQLETLIKGMLNKTTLLDLIRHFIVYEKSKREDPKTGQITIATIKKLAAYHQYYAVNKAVESVLRAANYSPPLEGWSKTGVVSSPPLEGWQTKSDGVVKRASKNYFSLPYNPKLKERARELRKAGNLAEVLFWQRVHKGKFKGLDFDRQKIIGNYIVDFYCPNYQVVIEIDGSSHDDKMEYDAERDHYLQSLGLTVIHISAKEILQSIDAVMQWLYDHPAFQGKEPSTPPSQQNFVEESPEQYSLPGVKQQPKGDRKGGVVWHTQGSGKSLSMVFFTGKIVLAMDNPTVVVITDRNDLDDQLFDTFAASTQLLRQEPKQAESRQDLKEKLKVASGGIIFTTIQKFQPEEGDVFETLSERENIIVIVDEAHRTQYGFKGKIDKSTGELKYGFAKYLRDALPNATYIGFTGTPVEKDDKNTPAVFGNYIDIYDIAQAVEDGATVPIYYESRLAKVNLSEEGRKLLEQLDEELEQEDLTETQKVKAKWTQLEALIGSESRLKNVAKDIVEHFEKRQEIFEGKGMIVTMSRRIAAELYEEIIKLRPEWHSDELDKGAIKVVMTSASSDGPKIAKHHTSKQQRKILAERMKDPNDELKLVIVRDMWLTGFDAPCMHTLYIDKPMKGHNLMQAIARVNRVYKDKPGGLVVDYLGIASDLKKALSFYSDSGGRGEPAIAQEQAVNLMLEKLEVVQQMLYGFDYKAYFRAATSKKLSIILEAQEHILSLEDGKKRFINEVTALSKAFALAVPHDKAMDVKDEVAFFQAVKARLAKFDATGSGKTNEEIETTIRQVIDKALVSEQVIDIFDAAGIKKPDISILSEEFLLELKGMEHKNVAMEVLKKLLNDEIKARSRTNLVKSKSLKEMLESAIKKYHNKILTAAEVIEELIKISKEIVALDKQAEELGLSDFEYAFYTAVAENKSARELMGKEKLRELAVVLTEKVKNNATIDWTIKESVRAKLKVIIKRTLRQYGYPPDMAKLATETVLKQAELIAGELTTA
ncbi:MAG: hypothetical protein KatS3mg033_1999 [Thermonema sp.]|uniref:HsdR family type I site-specific deoxyribonuclease n=1 Tax=Thermonema sp. TaxID=2231181 RepID=UPI0021DC0F78|nr:HsdR family type I site-specific deoxyribonuclease [Thermonema sp.]GIV40199.1 MAG: hypothetical protein KatS3mg033_1999 [Thermonema sp.]